jgi:hypothetical protein
MIIEQIETVIIGGGQAGLAMSHYLGQLGREHVILERQRVAERWRSERWDFPEPELEHSSARICLSVCHPDAFASQCRQVECQSTSVGSQEYPASISSACLGSTNASPHFSTASAKTRNILRNTSQMVRDRDFALEHVYLPRASPLSVSGEFRRRTSFR